MAHDVVNGIAEYAPDGIERASMMGCSSVLVESGTVVSGAIANIVVPTIVGMDRWLTFRSRSGSDPNWDRPMVDSLVSVRSQPKLERTIG